MLLTHLVSGLGWLGIEVVFLVLAVIGLTSDDPATVGACYQALGLFVMPTLLPAGLISLASGIVLGMGSKYGLLRYWWVAIKLVLNVILTALALVALPPRMGEAAELGRGLGSGELGLDAIDRLQIDLMFPPTVSITALMLASVLAVYKPWGRLRRGN